MLIQRMAAAPPREQGALAGQLARLAQALAAQEKREFGSPESFEEARLEQQMFEAQMEQIIDRHAMERAHALLNPPDSEYEARAKALARMNGGDWQDHLPYVHADQARFIKGLLNPESVGAEPADSHAQDAGEDRDWEAWENEDADR